MEFRTSSFSRPATDDSIFYCDMHFHSNIPHSPLTIAGIGSAIRSRNLRIAITDHNAIIEKEDKDIIPGIEMITDEGLHSILYFYDLAECREFHSKVISARIDKRIDTYLHMEIQELLDEASGYNSVSCLPHSQVYPKKRRMIAETLLSGNKVNCIETINSFIPHRYNVLASEFSKDISCSVTGGSDGRTINEAGNSVTAANAEDKQEFLDELRKGRTWVIGKETAREGKMKNLLCRPELNPKLYPFYLARHANLLVSGTKGTKDGN